MFLLIGCKGEYFVFFVHLKALYTLRVQTNIVNERM
jgi:hypothetical protein